MTLNVIKVLIVITFGPKCNKGPAVQTAVDPFTDRPAVDKQTKPLALLSTLAGLILVESSSLSRAPINGLPQYGGEGGDPRELDFVKRTWVEILTSTTVPRVGNLTQPPS